MQDRQIDSASIVIYSQLKVEMWETGRMLNVVQDQSFPSLLLLPENSETFIRQPTCPCSQSISSLFPTFSYSQSISSLFPPFFYFQSISSLFQTFFYFQPTLFKPSSTPSLFLTYSQPSLLLVYVQPIFKCRPAYFQSLSR